MQGKAGIEKTAKSPSAAADEKIAHANKTFKKKYPVLQKAHPPVAEYKVLGDFDKNRAFQDGFLERT